MSFSASEVVALVERAARGAGISPDQARSFGVAAAAHLSRERGEVVLRDALDPKGHGWLNDIPRVILSAQLNPGSPVAVPAHLPRDLFESYCDSLEQSFALDEAGGLVTAFNRASPTYRPQRLALSETFERLLKSLAENTFVPDSALSRGLGAGAQLSGASPSENGSSG